MTNFFTLLMMGINMLTACNAKRHNEEKNCKAEQKQAEKEAENAKRKKDAKIG